MKKNLFPLILCATIISCNSSNKTKFDEIDYDKSDTTVVMYYDQGYSDATGGIIVAKRFEDILALSQEGDMKAQFSLGRCYLYGEHVKKSYENAFKWFKLSAEQGFAMSQQELGLLYYEGNGVKQSFAEAVKWYRKSAEQGYSYGEHCLGVCYERGEGVQQSYEDAVQWYMKAANHGLDVSKINLALLLEAGNGTPQNLETAYNIF